MPADTDPAAIARRLTPAQKRALMWLPADGSARHREWRRVETPGSEAMSGLIFAELAEWRAFGHFGATPLGLTVRAALEAEAAPMGDARAHDGSEAQLTCGRINHPARKKHNDR